NKKLKQKLPPDAETANVLVGVADLGPKPITFLFRFAQPILMDDATEVDLPTRFLFVALGVANQSTLWQMSELGRATALLLNDKVFCEVAYKATSKQDFQVGLDEFLDDLTILPPSVWDPTTRLEPPPVTMTLERIGQRLHDTGRTAAKIESLAADVTQVDDSLAKTNKLFGGLTKDIKRKSAFYVSDITDGLSVQCLASIIFLYFACITPIVTFGGLMAGKTDGYMGTIEMLLSGAFCGITYAIFSGQPLTIVGATGPLLVFETIVFEICGNMKIPFMPFRFWIGIWIFIIMFLMVAFDLSYIIRYITRFTEESFAVLISVIFIYEAVSKLFDVWSDNRIRTSVISEPFRYSCECKINSSDECYMPSGSIEVNRRCISEKNCTSLNGSLTGSGCVQSVTNSVPDVFLLSCVLMFGTFAVAIFFRNMRSTTYFPTFLRSMIADFAVFLSLVFWTAVDYFLGLNTSKLDVPTKFQTTRVDRSWIINPLDCVPWWMCFVAIAPACLATILLFLDQQITAVIVNRKENKLQKGHGYHLDLLIISFQVLFCSFFGLPWFCAATVRSISHVKSLVRESDVNAPGESPKMLGIREQRVTGLFIHLLIGLSIFGAIFLKYIPMPILYGVFLYMGITSLNGVEYIDRILILFMPLKYQPDYIYLRHVQTSHVHLFTFIQLLCSALMWAVKSFKVTSIAFPLMLVLLVIVRKLMDYLFTQRDLYWLDNLLPEVNRRKKEDQLRALEFASQSNQVI
ncbi:hypothetical protein HELRODRAFT_69270, partial [Helobdella robusta]|uniref:Anion exchange protein n=1 Tax=Helobdella robusta TaxID=6412 RepID=T1FZS5_HELRO